MEVTCKEVPVFDSVNKAIINFPTGATSESLMKNCVMGGANKSNVSFSANLNSSSIRKETSIEGKILKQIEKDVFNVREKLMQ